MVNFKQLASMRRKLQHWISGGLILLLAGVLSGCTIEETNRTKLRDLDYTILAQEEIPAELLEQIEEKKTADFKVSVSKRRRNIFPSPNKCGCPAKSSIFWGAWRAAKGINSSVVILFLCA